MSLLYESSEDNQIYLDCFYKGFKHVLTFYDRPPLCGEIDLRSFQEIAAKRLALLQFIDSRSELKIKSHKNKEHEPIKHDQKTAERMNEIENKMLEFEFMLPRVLFSKDELYDYLHVAQRDIISHFILRLAFSRDKNKSDWFIRNECKLFDIRLERLRSIKVQEVDGVDKLESFLLNQGIKYEHIKNPMVSKTRYTTKEALEFSEMTRFRSDHSSIEKLYMVPFYPDASHLVRMRMVAIKNSVAFVPPSSLFVVISSRFKNDLQQSVKFLNENQQLLDTNVFSDDRFSEFLKILPESYLANDYSKFTFTDEKRLTLANINQIYRFTFPPCMRRLFSFLLKNHHLKHWGRQQLWLFLKGAGLTLEESLQLNRTLWNDANNFDKEHAYGIRHLYGKEGRRTNYPPYSCSRIINSLPPNVAGSAYGCPFKQLDAKGIYSLLQEFGLQSTQINPVIELKNTHQYQLACVEYFNQTTPNGCSDGIGTHPNIFFQASFKAKILNESNSQEEGNKEETEKDKE